MDFMISFRFKRGPLGKPTFVDTCQSLILFDDPITASESPYVGAVSILEIPRSLAVPKKLLASFRVSLEKPTPPRIKLVTRKLYLILFMKRRS